MMPLHRRPNAHSEATPQSNDTSPHNERTKIRRATKSKESSAKHLMVKIMILIQMLLLLLSVAWQSRSKSKGHQLALLVTAFIISLPVVLILAVGLGIFDHSSTDLPHQRYIPLLIIGTIIGNQLPSIFSSGMAAAGMLLFGLSSRPVESRIHDLDTRRSKSSRVSGPLKAVLAVILMTTVLLTENFFIWVVSATYEQGQQASNLPTPLQDNGQLILRYFLNNILEWTKRDIVKLRNLINVEWILVSGLGVSLVAVETQGTAMRRNLWSLALRGLFTLTIARAIRTISFLITVLPSQNPRCYFSHFPFPPPADWTTWLATGFIPQANGGCNDLIISGHATVTSTLACIVTSIVGKNMFTTALWLLVAVDYMVEVYEGFHYSVDMWLGAILVNFIWNALAPIEEASAKEMQEAATKQFLPLRDATRAEFVKYSIPVLVAYVQVNGFLVPAEKANYTIVAFILAVIHQISTVGFQQYTQHCLFSLLYLALGIYL